MLCECNEHCYFSENKFTARPSFFFLFSLFFFTVFVLTFSEKIDRGSEFSILRVSYDGIILY